MDYVQVWLKASGLPDAPDEPIKHPCWSPEVLDLEDPDGLLDTSQRTQLVNVASPYPAVFVEEAGLWDRVASRARFEKRTAEAVIADALDAYLGHEAVRSGDSTKFEGR